MTELPGGRAKRITCNWVGRTEIKGSFQALFNAMSLRGSLQTRSCGSARPGANGCTLAAAYYSANDCAHCCTAANGFSTTCPAPRPLLRPLVSGDVVRFAADRGRRQFTRQVRAAAEVRRRLRVYDAPC